jgi:hypothetical protein
MVSKLLAELGFGHKRVNKLTILTWFEKSPNAVILGDRLAGNIKLDRNETSH